VDFARGFADGATFSCSLGTGTLRTQQIADLVLTSGVVLAADAFISTSGIGLVRRAPSGTFPVTLSLARFDDDDDERVAFAMVRFRSDPPRIWEMATSIGQDPTVLADDEIFGYPVDSGTGCFMDLDTQRRLTRMSDAAYQQYSDALLAELEDHDVNTWSWANPVIDPSTGLNQVAFSSGLGDGVYASYWGLDEHGEIVCLATDFSLYLIVDGLLVGPPLAGA
jgi:hypothetical protein